MEITFAVWQSQAIELDAVSTIDMQRAAVTTIILRFIGLRPSSESSQRDQRIELKHFENDHSRSAIRGASTMCVEQSYHLKKVSEDCFLRTQKFAADE